MNLSKPTPFEDLFKDHRYILLKNHMYNYRLRKRAVGKSLIEEKPDLILEIGSGISPMVTRTNQILYTDLSYEALHILKRIHRKGQYIVADSTQLPFKSNIFSHIICSEVLEHIQDDLSATKEITRVMLSSGCFIATFPHKKLYFANDDRLVKHYRRYEIQEIKSLFQKAGLKTIYFQKVLGPLEKIIMISVAYIFSIFPESNSDAALTRFSTKLNIIGPKIFEIANMIFMAFAWFDAKIMPRSLSTVLLVKARLKS